jgi:hypothetical protein
MKDDAMNSTTAMRKIAELDLEQVKIKLMHRQSGEGWSAARADATEREYRRFLCMMVLHPQENFAPLLDVDMFWHYHILDTRKYAADCEQAFGYFLHHNPAVALGDTALDAAEHAALGQRMHALYEATFGEACRLDAAATAWCSLNASHGKQATAWCSLAAAGQRTAWCSIAANDAKHDVAGFAEVAWCSASNANAARQTAWCSLADTPAGRKTAWCSAARPAAAQGTAWCSLVSKTAAPEALTV